MIKKNQVYTNAVLDFGSNGEGIVKEDGQTVFIPFCIPSEKIEYKVLKTTSKANFGKVLKVIEKSNDRVEPKCKVFYKCGGCQLQHVNYEAQKKLKKETVKNCFNKIANVNFEVLDTVSGENQFGYRNKLQLPVQFDGEKTIIGFYAENSHRVIEIDDCIINPSWTKSIIKAFTEYISTSKIKGYSETDFTGVLREITVKEIDNKLIIVAVITTETLKDEDKLIKLLKSNLSQEFSLYLNINNSRSNVIYGEKFKLIYGKGEYFNNMLGIDYKIGVLSFTQVNNEVCKLLYSKVLELVNPDKNTVVIDAYSGAGLMTAIHAKSSKKAIGVEVVCEAVKCADELAKINNLTDKMQNYCGRCEDLLPEIIKKERKENSKISVILDPPRKGCDIGVINAILENDIDKIVYVSCMPSTLARDIGLLVGTLLIKDGNIVKVENPNCKYKIETIIPFDMFPQTKHVESVVCLVRSII